MTAWATNPQAAQIDALIERAARLTSVECDRLVAAWFATRDTAWPATLAAAGDTARAAARFATLVAAGDAARDRVAAGVAAGAAARVAAGDAARDAAWFAARVAAVALVVRDLIDEATPWNQAAYDLLTGPWRRVIGPIHPDDEVL